MERRAIVGVMGSGRETHMSRAEPLGRWLGSQGVHLLTGGGDGVMGAVAKAFVSVPTRRGMSIGVIPARDDGRSSPPGYPNPWVEIPIRTHLTRTGALGRDPQSRNHINVLSSDVIVALPGSAGTASEVELAVHYDKPVIAFVGGRGEIPGLPSDVPIAETLEDVQRFVERCLSTRRAGSTQ